MAVYVIEPSLTDDFICIVFKSLVLWEAKKLIGLDMDVQEGCQTGYIECLGDLFGHSEDWEVEQAFDRGETWLQVVASISEQEELSSLITRLTENAADIGLDDGDLEELENTVEEVVEGWISDNPQVARKAIRNI